MGRGRSGGGLRCANPPYVSRWRVIATGSKSRRIVAITEKRLLVGSDPVVTVTVKEQPFDVGVDPYNKMIDRVSRDNRKEVAVE